MLRAADNLIPLILVLVVITFSAGCGGNVKSASSNLSSLRVIPGTAVVVTGQTFQFSAEMLNLGEASIVWSVSGPSGANAGTISPSGLYTAPSSPLPSTVTVTATSSTNSGVTSTATIWVLGASQVTTTANPLVAQYTLTVPPGTSTKVDFGTTTSYGLRTWLQPAPTGGGPENILVAGMRDSTTYHMRAIAYLPDGTIFTDTDHTFTTGPLPATALP